MRAVSIGVPVPDTRNPFTGKGLAVTIALLLGEPPGSSLAQLAEASGASRPTVSKVVAHLRQAGLVTGSIEQGRAAALVAKPELMIETAAHWPQPAVWIQGGSPPPGHPQGGGRAVSSELGVMWTDPPRIYVRRRADISGALADAGGALVSEAVAEWGIAVVDFPFPPGALPARVLALELGHTPRGREVLVGVTKKLFPVVPAGGRS